MKRWSSSHAPVISRGRPTVQSSTFVIVTAAKKIPSTGEKVISESFGCDCTSPRTENPQTENETGHMCDALIFLGIFFRFEAETSGEVGRRPQVSDGTVVCHTCASAVNGR